MSRAGHLYIPHQALATSPDLFHAERTRKARERKDTISNALTGSPPLQLLQPSPNETLQQAAVRQQNNLLSLLGSHVAISSAYNSLTGWKHFTQFCQLNAIDLFLLRQHAHFGPSPYPFKATVLATFLTYLCVDLGLTGVTACTYLWAVRYAHECNHLETSAFDHKVLTLIRASCRRHFLADASTISRKRLPFTFDMLDAGLDQLWSMQILLHLAIVTAILTCITYLLRKSECLHGFVEDHYLRSQDVEFEIQHPITGVISWCMAHEAHSNANETLLSVKLNIRSAKNDQFGRGFPYENKVAVLSETCRFCIATVLWTYAKSARPLFDMPFFSSSIPGSSFILTYECFKAELKKAAQCCGFPSARIGTHSLRIFGASLLHAAGKDSLYIMHWGRWKSLCFMDYIQWSLKEMEEARLATSNPLTFLNEDLLKLHM